MAAHANDELPRPFGRFTLLRQLGRGGMGVVFLARDPNREGHVAIKQPTVHGDEVRQRFLREAQKMAKVRDDFLCPILESGDVDGQLYLTMPYIEGRRLGEWKPGGAPWAPAEAVQMVIYIAKAVVAMHVNNVIHRDLKPDNILVRPDGTPVVMDFGLARDAIQATEFTGEGQVLGTLRYMSPEQLSGEKVGPASDQYSLAMILYQLLCGQVAFSRGYRDQIMYQIFMQPPPPPRSLRPDLSPALEAICLKGLAKKVSDRYPSVLDFSQALVVYRDRGVGPAVPPPPTGGQDYTCPRCARRATLSPNQFGNLVTCPHCHANLGHVSHLDTHLSSAAEPPSLVPKAPYHSSTVVGSGPSDITVGRTRPEPARPTRILFGLTGLGVLLSVALGGYLAIRPPSTESATATTPSANQGKVTPGSLPLSEVLRLVRSDVQKHEPFDAHTQLPLYLHAPHLAPASGITEAERASYGAALDALSQQLSRGPRDVVRLLDDRGEVRALDLPVGVERPRDLLAGYPHGLTFESTEPAIREEVLAKAQVGQVWFVRADWLLRSLARRWGMGEAVLGATPPVPPAIRDWAAAWESRPVDLATAAAELGAAPEEVVKAIRSRDNLTAIYGLGPLTEGKSVSRAAWESTERANSAFQELARVLQFGVPILID